jgi:hypothetical protein
MKLKPNSFVQLQLTKPDSDSNKKRRTTTIANCFIVVVLPRDFMYLPKEYPFVHVYAQQKTRFFRDHQSEY